MADRIRRASRGNVTGPCPACHTGDEHPKDDICRDCRQLLDRARQIVAADTKREDQGWYNYGEMYHWNPGYYFHGVEFPDAFRTKGRVDLARRLQEAFHALVIAIAKDTHFDGSYINAGERRVVGPLVRRPRKWNQRSDSSGKVLLSTAAANAITELDLAIVQALAGVASKCFTDGADLLKSLMVGGTTLDDFNEDVAKRASHLRNIEVESQSPEPAHE